MAENRFLQSPIDKLIEESKSYELPKIELPERSEPRSAAQSMRTSGLMPPQNFQQIFEEASAEYGVPLNVLAALGQQESSYNPSAVGARTKWGRAKGLMQYLDSTASSLGINTFDAKQSIHAAAKQLRERLDKGYTLEEAIMAHHGGDNRKQWGPKTRQYVQEVMSKAGKIGQGFMQNAPQTAASEEFDLSAIQAELDAQEPGRFKVLSPEEAERYQRRENLIGGQGQLQAAQDALKPGAPSPLTIENQQRAAESTPTTAPSPLTPENQIRVENGLPPKDTRPYQGFLEATGNALSNVPERFQQSIAGLIQMAGEDLGLERERFIAQRAQQYGITPGDMKLLAWAGNQKLIDPKAPVPQALEYVKKNIATTLNEQQLKELAAAGIINPDEITAYAKQWREDTKKTMAEVRPEPGSAAFYGSAAISSLAEMAPMIAGAIITRSPTVAMGIMGGQVGGQSYAEAREKGLSEEQAQTYAVLTAAAEAAPEALVVGRLLKPGAGVVRKVFEGTVMEGAQEAVTAALQAGIDKQMIDPNMTLREALVQIRDSAIIGMLAGGGMGGVVAGAESLANRGQRTQQERIEPTIDGGTPGPTQSETTPPSAAPDTPASEAPQQVPPAAVNDNAAPAAQQAAPQPPNGPLSRAAERVIQQSGEPVTVVAPDGEVAGTLESYVDQGNGRWTARVTAEDGNTYDFTHEDGVDIVRSQTAAQPEPEAIEEASAIEEPAAVEQPAMPEQGAADTAPVVNPQLTTEQPSSQRTPLLSERIQAEAEKGLDQMSEAELRGELKAVAKQAKELEITKESPREVRNEHARLTKRRKAIEQAINTLTKPKQEEPVSAAKEIVERPKVEPTNSLQGEPASWVIRNKETGEVIMETFDKKKVDALNTEKYEAVPIQQHLGELNQKIKAGDEATVKESLTAGQPASAPQVGQSVVLGKGRQQGTITEVGDGFVKVKMGTRTEKMDMPTFNRRLAAALSAGGAESSSDRGSSVTSAPGNLPDRNAVSVKPANKIDINVGSSLEPGGLTSTSEGKTSPIEGITDAGVSNAKVGGDVVKAGSGRVHGVSGVNIESDPSSSRPDGDTSALEGGLNVRPADAKRIADIFKGHSAKVEDFGSLDVEGKRSMMGLVSRAAHDLKVRESIVSLVPVDVMDNLVGAKGASDRVLHDPAMLSDALLSVDVSSDIAADFMARIERASAGSSAEVSVSKIEALPGFGGDRSAPAASKGDGSQSGIAQYGKYNKVFTKDKADAARALLRSKLTQLNSGIDPEIIQAGITLAGYHVESGARTFAAYVKAMTEDMGEIVRPYLKSWYMGVKYDPRAAGFDGMSSAAEVEAFDLDAGDTAPEAPAAKRETVTTPAGREFEVQHKVIEADELVTSNDAAGAINPDYPKELQPRDRSRSASQDQINDIAGKLNPRLLGESASATDGAPIVSPDNVVESGNGRTLAIRQAYARGMADRYREWLASQGYDVAGMKAPVLVRERVTPMTMDERIAYTTEANDRTTLELSSTERALSDARKMGPILHLYRGGDLQAAANRDFVRAFVGDVAAKADRGRILDGDGMLSQDGRRRIEAALLGSAYGDETLITDLFESADTDIKAIGGALLDVAGSWAKMREDAREGVISESVDTTPNLLEAVNLIRRARAEGRPILELVRQNDFFSGELDPVTTGFMGVFYRGESFTRARGRDKVADSLRYYTEQAQLSKPGDNLFGEPEVSGAEILRGTNDRLQRQEQQAGQQQDIFASPRTDGENAGAPGGNGQGPQPEAAGQAPAQGGLNAPGSRERVERDRPDAGAAQPVVQAADGDAAGQDAEGAGQAGRGADGEQGAGQRDQRLPGDSATAGRERGDQPVYRADGQFEPESGAAGGAERAGSGGDSIQGQIVEQEREEAVADDAQAPGAGDLDQRLAAQRKAQNAPTKWGDKASIDAALPLLLPEQRDDVLKAEQRLAGHNGILYTNGTGTGKAQPLDARILTPRGWVRMGDIQVGDEVISVDGTPTKVLGVYPQGEKGIYRVTFDDGSSTECCDEHLWLTQTLYERRKASKNPEWNCAKPKVRELSEIRATLDKRHFIPVVAPVQLHGDISQNLLPAYTLGVILGDGDLVGGSLRFTNPDEEVASRVAAELPASMGMVKQESDERCVSYRLTNSENGTEADGTFSKGAVRIELERLGLHGTDSFGKFIPREYLSAKIADRIALLQGLMDTDGTADERTNSAYFTTVSPSLKDDFVELVQSLGGVARVSEKVPTYTYRGERRTGQKAYTVNVVLPEGIDPFSLPRKADKLKPRTWGQVRRKIVSVEFVGEKAAQCIAVEHESHLYVTDNYIVTHNTATGLGVAKRFINDGKDNIVIVVPSDKIASDWVKFARMLGVELKQLADTNDNGKTGPIVTTYANFGQNESLAQRDWDLVIADESHYLSSNEGGDKTAALEQLRALTGHHDGFYRWVRQRHAKEWQAFSAAMQDRADANGNPDVPMERYIALEAAEAKAREKWNAIEQPAREKWNQRWAKQDGLPKTVMLSATPFAYAKNVDYAEGYLFHYVEPADLLKSQGNVGGYNSGSPRDRFLMQHFGYRMRYNKLTAPESGVNSQLMEQQFNQWLKSTGALSGRRLEVAHDYDRKFVLVDDAVGTKIDEGLKYLREAEEGRYREVYEAVSKQFDYQRRMYLLESMKARAAVPIIREHLALGRKIVVFHDFNKGGGFNPFNDAIREIIDPDVKSMARSVLSKPMFKLDFTGLFSPIETLGEAFPDALFFNGTVSKGQRRANADLFNDDDSGRNLIVVQSDAGREGVSLHDTTGKHQRVEINLGMPVKPVAATQIEGRIYRTGQASDAIFRYLTTGTAWEAAAFASKIAERASTAENLALGEEARGLKEAFIDAYQNADAFPASAEDGKGGKDYDRKLSAAFTTSPFDRAKTFYWAQQKNSKRRDQREGQDYFATPEPVGFKMVEWANIQPNDKALEPSAGHGAIARFFPEQSDVTMVEPSYELSQRAALANGNARIVNDRFEQLHINNKFDAIVMNPPYGSGGKTSTEHLAKAAKHLRDGGRIVALIPRGGMADKRLDAFLESEEAADLYTVAKIAMPAVTFERAGTAVNTQVLVLEKHTNAADADGILQRNIDLSNAESVNELFDRLESLSLPDRQPTSTPEPKQEIVEHTTAKGKVLRGIIRTDLTKAEAQEIDKFTFAKKNADGKSGWFIRAKHLDDAPRYSVQDGAVQGEFGPIFQANSAAEAIERLMREKTGEAIITKPGIGEISLIYGDRNMGLAHIAARRGEAILQRLGNLIDTGEVYTREGQTDRVFIGNDRKEAVIRMTWNGQAKTWLLSAYEKYPDLSTAEAPQQGNRSQVVADRAGEAMSAEDVREAITGGIFGSVVDKMVEKGLIVIHSTSNSLPKDMGRGKRGVQAVTEPGGKVHLVASNLTQQNANAVLLHEMFHSGVESLVGSKRWADLQGRLGSLYRQAEQSRGKARGIYDRARARVADAKAQGAVARRMEVEEFGAYMIEEYESLPAGFRKWVDDLVGAIKAWMFSRYGRQIGQVTPAQLRALAKDALITIALHRRGELFGPIAERFSVSDEMRYSVRPSEAFNDLNQAQKDFLDKIGPTSLPQRLRDRFDQLTDNLGLRIRQAGVDRYAALLRNDQALLGADTLEGSIASSAWVLARMSHAAGGAVSAMMDAGRIYLDPKEKVIDVREGTQGLAATLRGLGSPVEIDRFMGWIAANRANKLFKQGRENLFSHSEIEAGMKLSGGKLENGKSRSILYAKAWKELQQHRDDVLGIAEQAGLLKPAMSKPDAGLVIARKYEAPAAIIKQLTEAKNALDAARTPDMLTTAEQKVDMANDALLGWLKGAVNGMKIDMLNTPQDRLDAITQELDDLQRSQRELWSEEFYVPFYRVIDEDSIGGPRAGSGLSRQQAYKKLKGGKQHLNDLLDNTLLNFHHLIQASLKNQAAAQAMENAEALGIAEKTTEAKRDKKASTYVMIDGEKQWYDVSDPLTFKAVSALSSAGLNTPVMKVGRAFKRFFTNMTTITPQFVVANGLRDTLSAMATSPTSAVPFKTAFKGALTYWNDQNRARMMASGGAFSFGHVYGQNADEIKASLAVSMRKAKVLRDPKLIPGALLTAWRKYHAVTDFAENINRAGIWERNLEKGKLKAAFEARDLMDFSAHGDAIAIRILTDLVPFLNARIQGLDKLYRAGLKPGAKVATGKGTKSDRQAFARFAAVVGALTVVSVLLFLNNHDDDEYRKLEDWQRDTYWIIRIGDEMFFIPKPFEVGAIATMGERLAEQFVDPAVGGEKFAQRLGHMLTDTFAFDPTPQLVKPAVEVFWKNKDSFTGRPIEDQSMERLSPSLRSRPDTSRLADAASRGMEAAAGAVGGQDLALSPVQIDHLIRGYTGSVGATAVATADTLWRRAMGEELPARRWHEYQPIKRFYRDLTQEPTYTRYGTDFYEALKKADRAYSSLMHLRKYDEARAKKYESEHDRELKLRDMLKLPRREITQINAEMKKVQMDKTKSGESKRLELDRLRSQRNMIMQQVGEDLEREAIRRRAAAD